LDTLFIVTSLNSDFNLNRIARYLSLMREQAFNIRNASRKARKG
jgi:putative ribosome biogenesis GTPase RsgA